MHVDSSSPGAGAELAVGKVLSPRLSWQRGLCLNTQQPSWGTLGLVYHNQRASGTSPSSQGQGQPCPLIVAKCSDHEALSDH